MTRFLAGTVMCTVLTCSASVLAQSQGAYGEYAIANNPHMTLGNPAQDSDFVKNSMNTVGAEIEWSKIAEAKSANPDVKALANETVAEDTPVAERLVAEAKMEKAKIPDGLNGKYKKEAEKLNSLSGDAFDKEYLDAMVKLQHDDVGAMRGEAENSRNNSLKAFASKDADQVSSRVDAAQTLEKQLAHK